MARPRKAATASDMGGEDIKSYLHELIQTLPSKSDLTAMKEEVISKFDELVRKVQNLESRVIELEDRSLKVDQKIEVMEAQLALRDNTIELLKKSCDDQEQYSRRNCLRFIGIPLGQDEDKDVRSTVRQCLTEMGVADAEVDIDRAHRIGKPKKNAKTGMVEQQVIVKFRSWSTRTKVYRARPKVKQGTRHGKFSVMLDLTKRRQALLSLARNMIASDSRFSYAFADVNCKLGIKHASGAIRFFETEDQLRNLVV